MIYTLSLICSCFFSHSSLAYSIEAQQDELSALPNSEISLPSKHFSGYLNISSTKYIHYFYIESEHDPSSDPVIFWTNGGPGCSGLLALFTEFGPWRPTAKGATLQYNPYTWTKKASFVFLEQPIGVGFSYSTDNIESNSVNDFVSSHDNVNVIKRFFEKFPERINNDLYISSESYGGHYIPQLTLRIFQDKELIKTFKGFLVGNPFVGFNSGSVAMANTLWGLQLIPKPLWSEYTKNSCDDLSSNPYKISGECWTLLNKILRLSDETLNPYALEYPTCIYPNGKTTHLTSESILHGLSPQTHQHLKFLRKAMKYFMEKNNYTSSTFDKEEEEDSNRYSFEASIFDTDMKIMGKVPQAQQEQKHEKEEDLSLTSTNGINYDPCLKPYMIAYLTRLDVQRVLHVIDPTSTATKPWDFCDSNAFNHWPTMDYFGDTTHLYSEIFNHPLKPKGFKMLVISGDVDGVCSTYGTQHWMYSITNSAVTSMWKPWYVDSQVAGYETKFNDSLSFLTVRNAGHEVPSYQPERALHLFGLFLDGSAFDTTTESSQFNPSDYFASLSEYDTTVITITFSISCILCFIMILSILYLCFGKDGNSLQSPTRSYLGTP